MRSNLKASNIKLNQFSFLSTTKSTLPIYSNQKPKRIANVSIYLLQKNFLVIKQKFKNCSKYQSSFCFELMQLPSAWQLKTSGAKMHFPFSSAIKAYSTCLRLPTAGNTSLRPSALAISCQGDKHARAITTTTQNNSFLKRCWY